MELKKQIISIAAFLLLSPTAAHAGGIDFRSGNVRIYTDSHGAIHIDSRRNRIDRRRSNFYYEDRYYDDRDYDDYKFDRRRRFFNNYRRSNRRFNRRSDYYYRNHRDY